MLRGLINYTYPPFIILLYFLIFIGTRRLVIYLKNRVGAEHDEKRSAVRHVVGSISAFYSIFLGFNVYIIWNNYQKCQENIVDESIKLYIMWQSTSDFSPPYAQPIQNGIKEYLSSIIDDEWVTMSYGNRSEKTQAASDKVYALLKQYRPTDPISRTYYSNAIYAFNSAIEYRAHRLNMLNIVLPYTWYIIIFLGTFIIISVYSSETHLKDSYVPFILCFFLAFYMTAITLLSFPFSGHSRVSNKAFVETYKLMNVGV